MGSSPTKSTIFKDIKMTDRVNALVVTLDKDIRIDDVQHLVDAIRMLRGVMSVDKNITDISDHVAEMRARTEMNNKLMDIIRESR